MASRHLEYAETSIYRYLYDCTNTFADVTAIEYFGKKINYPKLFENIDKVAKALKGLGVKEGDAVSICMPNTPEAIYLFYAVSKIGAVANMIHPLSAEKELIHYFNLSKSKFVFGLDMSFKRISKAVKESKIEKCVAITPAVSMPFVIKTAYSIKTKKPELESNVISWKEFMNYGNGITEDVEVHPDKDACAVILYSGGTTGKSKGIMLSNYNFNCLAKQSADACGNLYKGIRVLSIMPIFHGFGLGVSIHTILSIGATSIVLPSFKASEFHKILFKYRPNLIAGVPALYESLLKVEGIENKDLSFLEIVISGGDSLAVTTKEKLDILLKKCNCKTEVREGFGQTECVTGSCLLPLGVSKPGSVGLPYADTFYKIVDPQTYEELPAGEIGEIILRGPTVMLGYIDEPEETANTLRKREDGYTWLHTGDLGYIDSEGYVFFKQRLKRMIISGGYNIYPQVIENVIDSHSNVLISAVVGMPDQVMGEICKAFIVLKDKSADKDQTVAEIKKLCSDNVAKYALPREYIILDDVPRTLVGKIAYRELIDKYAK